MSEMKNRLARILTMHEAGYGVDWIAAQVGMSEQDVRRAVVEWADTSPTDPRLLTSQELAEQVALSREIVAELVAEEASRFIARAGSERVGTFATPGEAWDALQRHRLAAETADGSHDCPDPGCPWNIDGAGSEYTDELAYLGYIADGSHRHGDPHEDYPTNADGTGSLTLSRPGSHKGNGIVYAVELAP